MITKKFLKLSFSFLLIFFIIIFTYNYFNKANKIENITKDNEKNSYNLNIIKNVKYITKDKEGNEYIINASEAEIDYSRPNILFLTKVNSLIKLNNSNEITIVSDYGKYNSENLDTIFSKNVIIKYLDNKITGDYLDFSLKNNLMVISKNVKYENLDNTLKSDVLEMNIKTKNTKIFMYEENKKVNIKSKN